MSNVPISPQLRRFILTSVGSVPHLEAIVLLKTDAAGWDAARMAQSLFVSERKAGELLEEMAKAGFVSKKGAVYFYDPAYEKLGALVEELVRVYPHNLIEITNLIHSNIRRQAQKFGDAFKWGGQEE
jgi:hypothetical protein